MANAGAATGSIWRGSASHGFEQDYDRPSAYQYRDAVIEAFNLDLPYDTFVKWQLAGDGIAPDDHLASRRPASSGAGVHSTQITKREVEKHRYDEMDDTLATIGQDRDVGPDRGRPLPRSQIRSDPAGRHYRMLSTFTTTVRSDLELDLDPQWNRQAKAAFEHISR